MEVVWTRKASSSFNKVVDYLLSTWSIEIATNFVNEVDHTIELIVQNPEMFKNSKYDISSREAFITKHTTMFYRVLDSSIEIEYFWGNFDNPSIISNVLNTE